MMLSMNQRILYLIIKATEQVLPRDFTLVANLAHLYSTHLQSNLFHVFNVQSATIKHFGNELFGPKFCCKPNVNKGAVLSFWLDWIVVVLSCGCLALERAFFFLFLGYRVMFNLNNNNNNNSNKNDNDNDDNNNNNNNNNHHHNHNHNHIHRRNSRFFTVSSLRREPSPTRTLMWPKRSCVQTTCSTSSACHVQHVVLSATWYEGTAQLVSLTVEIAVI